MEDIKSAEQPPVKQSTYTVSSFLARISATVQSHILNKTPALVQVEGTAGKINPYNKIVFFDLKSGSEKITVRCPSNYGVSEGEHLIVEGTVTVNPSNYHDGLQVLLNGKPVGDWKPRESKGPSSSIEKKSFLRLEDYLCQGDLESFLLLGTDTAVGDVLSTVEHSVRKTIAHEKVRVNSKENFLADLKKQLDANSCDAFAIVRGGDDDSLSVWDDAHVVSTIVSYGLPFYLATGHAHRMTLANQYADSSFHTPSALGTCINDSLKRALHLSHLREENQELETANSVLAQERAKLEQTNSVLSQRSTKEIPHRKPYVEWALIALLVGLLVKGL